MCIVWSLHQINGNWFRTLHPFKRFVHIYFYPVDICCRFNVHVTSIRRVGRPIDFETILQNNSITLMFITSSQLHLTESDFTVSAQVQMASWHHVHGIMVAVIRTFGNSSGWRQHYWHFCWSTIMMVKGWRPCFAPISRVRPGTRFSLV